MGTSLPHLRDQARLPWEVTAGLNWSETLRREIGAYSARPAASSQESLAS